MPVVPFTVAFGVAMSSEYRNQSGAEARDQSDEPELHASLGWRSEIPTRGAPLGLTIGVRGDWSRYGYHYEQRGNSTRRTIDTTVDSYDVGLFARLEYGRFWVAPWIGEHEPSGTDRTTDYTRCMTGCIVAAVNTSATQLTSLLTAGVSVGVDLWIHDPHRLSAFASIQGSKTAQLSFEVSESFTAIAVGLEYRL
jgi:hypothetical protein